jgi:Domain of unknown function (DUF1905)/Bacteriocin-protection, YdeI or OmpD-Associated
MVQFSTIIEKFGQQGEKTGWTYIKVNNELAQKLIPGNKKAFRVKGRLDEISFSAISLIPVGGGDFIMPLNARIRKEIKKSKGASIRVHMEVDNAGLKPPSELMECLEDEPEALSYFKSLARSHQNYYCNWINNAKTDPTKARRIALTIDALKKEWNFGQMIRASKASKLS